MSEEIAKPPAAASKFAEIFNQFKGLDTRNPASWPLHPQLLLYAAIVVGVIAVGWIFVLSSASDALQSAASKEEDLKKTYVDKYSQAVNLQTLEEQRKQVQRYVTQLEKQLPNKAEMDSLLSDINQAGLGRGLQFELFKPGAIVAKQYYAELPIEVKVTGRYHDIGQFASDIASLSRIVTLNNMALSPTKDGSLSLNTTIKTFRYLDPDEAKNKKSQK